VEGVNGGRVESGDIGGKEKDGDEREAKCSGCRGSYGW
jgi:hypothetical protein